MDFEDISVSTKELDILEQDNQLEMCFELFDLAMRQDITCEISKILKSLAVNKVGQIVNLSNGQETKKATVSYISDPFIKVVFHKRDA